MGVNTKDFGSMICGRAMEYKSLKTGLSLKVNITKTKNRARESFTGQMAIFMKAISRITNVKARAS